MTSPGPIPREYQLALDTAEHRADQVLKQAMADAEMMLKRAGITGDNEFGMSELRSARRILLQIQNNVWRDVQRVIGMNRYDAAVAAVNLPDLAPLIRKEVLDQLESARLTYTDVSSLVRGAARNTEGWMNNMLGDQMGNTGSEALAKFMDWLNPDTQGGLSYAVDRMTQSQMSDGFHDAQVETADVRGIATVFWRLDPGHEIEDECDDYADQEYNVDEVPDIPHIGCLCYLEDGQQIDQAAQQGEGESQSVVQADQTQADYANRLTYDEMNNATIKGAVEVPLKSTPDVVQGWAEYLRSSAGSDATVRVMQTPSGGYTYHVFK